MKSRSMTGRRWRWGRGYAVLCTGLVNALLLLALLNGLLAGRYRHADRGQSISDQIVSQYGTNTLQQAYPDMNLREIERLLAETWDRQIFEYHPFTQFREQPFRGRYVNVSPHGYRLTKNQGAWPLDPTAFNIFLLGGSTANGYGVRDEDTLASQLQDILARRTGADVRVYNFARGAYYSTLERLLLNRLLLDGHIPDLAIFMDGINDCYGYGRNPVLSRQIQRNLDLENRTPSRRLLVQWLQRQPLARWVGERFGAETTEQRPAYRGGSYEALDIEKYLRNKNIIEAVGERFDVPVLFVWHPSPYYKYDLSRHPFAQSNQHSRRGRQIAAGYAHMAEYVQANPMSANFLWYADVQEEVAEWLYVDDVHFSPAFIGRLADMLAGDILARVPSGQLLD